MSTSETMWDDDEDRSMSTLGNPALPQFSMEQQEVMLKRKAVLLDEFLRNGGMEPRAVEDRIQILHERINTLEAELTGKGKWDAARRYIEHAPKTDFDAVDRDGFIKWIGSQTVPSKAMGPFATSHFDTANQLKNSRALQSSRNSRTHLAPYPNRDTTHRREESPDASASSSHRSKRLRTTDNEKPPCLRCKILKKRCDSLEQCSHCPEQSFDHESDFWKVLGCYRGHMHGLSAILCPTSSRATRRIIRHPDGSSDVINFVLTRSRVSIEKRKRILQLVKTNVDFSSLNHASWSDSGLRSSLATAASSLDQLEDSLFGNDPSVMNDYEACWAVLQAIYMDPIYLNPTRYNFFRLIRMGNGFADNNRSSWEIFTQAKRLLRQSVEIYLLERLCGHIASGNLVGPTPFLSSGDPSSNNLILVDIKDDMERFLDDMETICAGRGKLTGQPQLACFYALLVFGVAKSMLIDAYAVREAYEGASTRTSNQAVAINSAYKALVSAFCWASRADVVLQECGDEVTNHKRNSVWGTCSIVCHDQWEERGIKGTKEFLLSLGSSVASETVYNGFFPQKFDCNSKITPPKLKSAFSATTTITRQDNGNQYSSHTSSESHMDPILKTRLEVAQEARRTTDDLADSQALGSER